MSEQQPQPDDPRGESQQAERTRSAHRQHPTDLLKQAALVEFAAHGYEGASLQEIASKAGYTKANLLYHFGSKQGLFEQAVLEALGAFEELVDSLQHLDIGAEDKRLVGPFVDFLLQHRLAVHMFVNHRSTGAGEFIATRVDPIIERLVAALSDDDPDRALRIAIGLAGVTYCLANENIPGEARTQEPTREELVAALTFISATRR
ncbi:TetR/AcrR family transcriptional regulator [Pseudoclavibacter helvolus]|uniref:AcrR family transcriptional regulator n=1 Tax=Pseudoclavibacter helvolus TaxID=255205 RepID=A0A7W4UMY1_9MICO|nr:TetR/AcrR family transcriptional regulator [Pseudoclavibacter helvolus]MBB2957430.1 AcrR family transcriptional regulator [Pseudoclavibacter helvolus]